MLHASIIKTVVYRLGFEACGVTQAGPVEEQHAERLRKWVEQGQHAQMDYMAGHMDMRLDPRLLVEGVKTIVSVAMNYMPPRRAAGISLYAQGRDYHDVMRERMKTLMEEIGGVGRVFVDTAPVLERYWAWRSGLGWIGRNHQLIIPGKGSTFFLGELFLTEEADSYDAPLPGGCGDCMRCVEACPTGALTKDGMDARRCLSYLTIEHRGALPEGTRLEGTFYGCDRCQEACPHLRSTHPTAETAFHPSEALLAMTAEDWRGLSVEQYRELFRGSAVKRAKYEGLKRNIHVWKPEL